MDKNIIQLNKIELSYDFTKKESLEINIKDPLYKLLSNIDEVNYCIKKNNPELMSFLYFNRIKIHKILYDSDKIISISTNMINNKLSNYFYLSLLIKDNPDILNYEYSFDLIKEINNELENNTNDDNVFKNIMLSKISLELIENFEGDTNASKELYEKNNTNIIKNNEKYLKDFGLNEKNIKKSKIDEIYSNIINILIKTKKIDNYEYAYNIINQLDLENIEITKTMFDALSTCLDIKNNDNDEYLEQYIIKDINDVYNNNIINFYYFLFKYILKLSIYIYHIPFLLQTKKNITKIIKSHSIDFNKDKTFNEKFEYILKFISLYNLEKNISYSNPSTIIKTIEKEIVNNNINSYDNNSKSITNNNISDNSNSNNKSISNNNINDNSNKNIININISNNSNSNSNNKSISNNSINDNSNKNIINNNISNNSNNNISDNNDKNINYSDNINNNIKNNSNSNSNSNNVHANTEELKQLSNLKIENQSDTKDSSSLIIDNIIFDNKLFDPNGINNSIYKILTKASPYEIIAFINIINNEEEKNKNNNSLKKKKKNLDLKTVECFINVNNNFYISCGVNNPILYYDIYFKRNPNLKIEVPRNRINKFYEGVNNRQIICILKNKLYNIKFNHLISREKIENYFKSEIKINEIVKYNIILKVGRDKYIMCEKQNVYFVEDFFNQIISRHVNKLFNFMSKGGIRLEFDSEKNSNNFALFSNSVIKNGEDIIILSSINSKQIDKSIKGYSFNLSLNSLSLMRIIKKKKIKDLLICSCKKYKKSQKNGILLINLNKEFKYEYFLDTGDFEVYCCCQLLIIKNYNSFIEDDVDMLYQGKINKVYTNYFLAGGFMPSKSQGLIKLYKIKYNSTPKPNFKIIFKQNFNFQNNSNICNFNKFRGPISSIVQSKITGNIVATCWDGNIYLFTPANILGLVKKKN